MLRHFETAAGGGEDSLLHSWPFKAAEGDVRCIADVINIAVQASLVMLIAVPAADEDAYRLEE